MRARAGIIASHYPARSILACSKTLRHYAFKEFVLRNGRKAPIVIQHRDTNTITDFQMADHGSMMTTKPVGEAARTYVDENFVSESRQ
jgi:hypothetical protein